MRLTEREIDKLLIFLAAEVARRRLARGLKDLQRRSGGVR
jgi:urease gamma subunit